MPLHSVVVNVVEQTETGLLQAGQLRSPNGWTLYSVLHLAAVDVLLGVVRLGLLEVAGIGPGLQYLCLYAK